MPTSKTSLLSRYHQLVQVLASLARNSHEVEAVVRAVHRHADTLFHSQVTLLALLEPGGDWRWELREEDRRLTQHVPFYPHGIMESVLRGEALSIGDIDAYLQEHPARVRRMTCGDVVVADIQQPDEAGDDLSGEPALSMLFVPLEVRGERAGVLSVQSYAVDAFDDTDLEFLQLLGQHVSIALENAALREELGRLTRTDALTGLGNRRAFSHDVPQAMDTARQGGSDLNLVVLDVHEFKRINDTHGHQVGDAVLALLGQILRRGCAAPDAAYRLGGDEFALLVWGDETRLAERLGQLTAELRAAAWPPGPGPVCLQAGAVPLPPRGNLDDWLSLADVGMYRAKRRRVAGRVAAGGLDFGNVVCNEVTAAGGRSPPTLTG